MGELTNDMSAIDFLMERPNVIPRFNNRILSSGDKFLDFLGTAGSGRVYQCTFLLLSNWISLKIHVHSSLKSILPLRSLAASARSMSSMLSLDIAFILLLHSLCDGRVRSSYVTVVVYYNSFEFAFYRLIVTFRESNM